jgi:indole-3-glycerol phosphate synthase
MSSGEPFLSGEDALTKICADTRKDVARRKAETPIPALRSRIDGAKDRPRGFFNRLTTTVANGGYGLVAEIKMASPSGGLIRPDLDPAGIARAYAEGGASCLSVLTDKPYFGGDIAHLQAARAAVDLPVLRKDFILDPWQIYESRAIGADCILLIMAALSNDEARDLEALTRALDMDVLAEVHDEQELDRALGLQTALIGVNNRNLKTLKTDLQTTIDLAASVPADRFLISESGIRTHEDVQRIAAVGARAFLVGESLLRQPDLTGAVRSLLGLRKADAA